jgi:hypothetical protein
MAIVRQDKLLWVATMDKMVSCYTSKSLSCIVHLCGGNSDRQAGG